jgi:hypothetical protein
MRKEFLLLASLLPLFSGCDEPTGSERPGSVSVRFQAASSAGASTSEAGLFSLGGASFDHTAATNPIVIAGSNGTMVIQDIRVIVSEVELERTGAECADDDDPDCEDFEGGPYLVNLLDGTASHAISETVPAGTYSELEFEVEDLDSDGEDDSTVRERLQSFLTELRGTEGNPGPYPAFPSEASMVVHGTFEGEPFTVYFAAEIEVEKEFARPFRVPEDGAILVNLFPEQWFAFGGTVLDLRSLDGQTVEFEAEFDFEGGIEIEIDDDDD